MPITATNTQTQREPIPAGNYIARCYQMIEIGTVKETILVQRKDYIKSTHRMGTSNRNKSIQG